MKGRVLIVGGSEEYAGAPYLAAMAALRYGAESVLVMTPEKVAWSINALSPDPVSRKLKGAHLSPSHSAIIKEQLKTADVLVIGNGATTKSGSATLMRSLMKLPILKVIDADAIKVMSNSAITHAVLTPNPREWKLLEKIGIQKLLHKNVIVKKTERTTVIMSGTKKHTISHLHPNLTKAGTGDVLSGLIAGNLARGMDPFRAAKDAANVGNTIMWSLTKKHGRQFDLIASDILRGL